MPDAPRWPTRVGAAASALALIVFGGLVQGQWTGRWSTSRELEEAVAALDRIPLDFGDWQGRSLELDPQQVAQGEIDGYISRSYANRRSGAVVQILLVCGRPGPISLHTPDVCYRGAGFAPDADPADRQVEAGPRAATMKTARFSKANSVTPQSLRISWAWNGAGAWEAPGQPRVRYGFARALYKLYVVRDVTSGDDESDEAFLREFLPVLDGALFPVEAGTDASAGRRGA